jgi:tetratricopeptide (TPR) repeat protein
VSLPEVPVRKARICVLPVAVALASLSIWQPSAQTPTVTAQLDRYLAGEFNAVAADLRVRGDYDRLLETLQRDAPGWILAGGDADRRRRTLAAATFALQAAEAAERVADWKWVQRIDLGPGESYRPPPAIWWKAPALLIEWGCALLREQPDADPTERLWQLASIALAQRAGDYEFLIGSPWDERGNPQDEIEHANHIVARFPDEPRFVLAQAIAAEYGTWSTSPRRRRLGVRHLSDVVAAFRAAMRRDPIAAEARVRLGFVQVRARRPDDAIELFEEAERSTRDPYVVYLGRYFRGLALEMKNRAAEAEIAYRDALAAVPRAQSASMALATLLSRAGRVREAAAIVEASLAEPVAVDPWREYGAADYRFWPYLVSRLHEEIGRATPRPEVRR